MKYVFISLFLSVALTLSAQVGDLSDEFNRTCNLENWLDLEVTEGWTNTHIESYDVHKSNPDMLTIVPYTTAWFAGRRSNLRYKEVSGDFVFTTELTALNRAETGQPSSGSGLSGVYSLAGLMVRTPRISTTDPENYIFLSAGSANSTTTPQLEVKTTTDSGSNLWVSGISTTENVQIRIVRRGSAFITMYREPGGDWMIRRRFSRSDMPDTLQVGFVAYTDWNKVNSYSIAFHNQNTLNTSLTPDPTDSIPFRPDIVAKFDYGRFEEVNVPAMYADSNFASQPAVSNAVVLSLFGYDSESHDVEGWHIWEGSNSDWASGSNWNSGTPTSQDSVVVPHCGCPQVLVPTISADATIASLIVEDQGQLVIEPNVTLTVDLSSVNAQFSNHGTIVNEGILLITNSSDGQVENLGVIECVSGGEIRIQE